MPGPGVLDARTRLERIATDSSLDPVERVRALNGEREFLVEQADMSTGPARDDYLTLAGQADSYIGSVELGREAAALDQTMARIEAREGADVRTQALARGDATPEELDFAGMLSHDALDEHEEDGTMEDAVLPLLRRERAD